MYDLPEVIQDAVMNEKYKVDCVGMSNGDIRIFADKVLKISTDSAEPRNEIQLMKWLAGRLSVPGVIADELKNDKCYLLMTKVPGNMACDEIFMNDAERLAELLSAALRRLWDVDISDCPFDRTLDYKLQAAKFAVENGLVDMENTEPETFGAGGFADPDDLLQWLIKNRPEEELVFSHGDFCLPNIFIAEDGTISYIDLGRAGIADKWCDIALCYRSLKHNYVGKYAAKKHLEFDSNLLFEKLGIAPDWVKVRYYLLLDELF